MLVSSEKISYLSHTCFMITFVSGSYFSTSKLELQGHGHNDTKHCYLLILKVLAMGAEFLTFPETYIPSVANREFRDGKTGHATP